MYPKLIGLGWERFAEVVPRELGTVILRLVEDPSPLVRELEKGPLTLIHGDYEPGNVGIARDGRVVAIDWAMACAAPPETELTWLLTSVDEAQSRDDVIAAWRRIRGEDFDPARLRLALLYEVVMSGYRWAYLSHWSPNPEPCAPRTKRGRTRVVAETRRRGSRIMDAALGGAVHQDDQSCRLNPCRRNQEGGRDLVPKIR